jgi:hypothetical protein
MAADVLTLWPVAASAVAGLGVGISIGKREKISEWLAEQIAKRPIIKVGAVDRNDEVNL